MSRLIFILDLGLILYTIGEMCKSPFHLKTELILSVLLRALTSLLMILAT